MLIRVDTLPQGYDIAVEEGVLARAGELLDLDRRVLVVTDSGVPEGYPRAVADMCAAPTTVCVPMGEASKCFERLTQLLSAMLRASFDRGDCVVAVGGGVVGDLSGFAASCYMRGIDFYNIPTTLLAQVDSSIGGKTAIDFEGVKNIVGAFYQPKKVLIDPLTLETLAERQLRAGLAEAIKMAACCDGELFELIEGCGDIRTALPEIIVRSLEIKRAVVEKDTREAGLRRVLNFGHTVGHAVESLNEGRLLHGECVALGMLPMCGDGVRERLARVLEKHGLPTQTEAAAEELMPYILHDKKMRGDRIAAVTVDKIGEFEFAELSCDQLRERLERAL